jgi:hypothetical protein
MDITLTVTENLKEPIWSPKRWECSCDFPTFSVSSSDRDRAIDEARGIALCAIGQMDRTPAMVQFLGAKPIGSGKCDENLRFRQLLRRARDVIRYVRTYAERYALAEEIETALGIGRNAPPDPEIERMDG